MSIRPGKSRQTTISASKPSASQTTCDKKTADEDSSVSNMPLDFEGFKRELREDLVGAMKKEVRFVLESELGFFKSEVLALKSGLEEFKNTTNSELAKPHSTLASSEHTLSTCSDDVTTLQCDVKRLAELADTLQNKCEDSEGRSRRNNVRIAGLMRLTWKRRPWSTDRIDHYSLLHKRGGQLGLS